VSSTLATKVLEAPHPPQTLDLAEIYRRYVQLVGRWAARLGGPQVEAEDVVQDVFLSVRAALPQFRGQASLTTWLYRITENAVSRRRRRLRWRRWLKGSAEDVAGGMTSPRPSPAEDLESREAATRLYRALDQMKERPRNLLILFEMEELSGEEIAQLTGTKTATVWVQLHRARAELIALLEAQDKREH
jgi:RNA polymerase sigma-70 factor (ECF subfamily)